MSKYQLEDLLNEITGTGRIGTYLDTYRGLLNKIDQIEDKGIRVKKLGMSGDGKVPFEFEIYPGDKDEAFSVYPYKFDPADEDDMQEFPFSIGGKPVAIRVAKELLGQGAMSNAEVRDAKDELKSTGDEIPAGFEESEKKELPKSFKDEEEKKAEIEARKNSGAFKGMMKEEEGFTEVNKEEVRFHLDAYEAGTIDGDDLAKAIEEIVFGDIVAPGMNSDDDFEREQRMQMSMRETPEPPEGMFIDHDEFMDEIVKDRAKEIKPLFPDLSMDDVIDFVKVHLDDIRGKSDEEIKDEYREYESVNTPSPSDFKEESEKSLREHFGRFMKDYQ